MRDLTREMLEADGVIVGVCSAVVCDAEVEAEGWDRREVGLVEGPMVKVALFEFGFVPVFAGGDLSCLVPPSPSPEPLPIFPADAASKPPLPSGVTRLPLLGVLTLVPGPLTIPGWEVEGMKRETSSPESCSSAAEPEPEPEAKAEAEFSAVSETSREEVAEGVGEARLLRKVSWTLILLSKAGAAVEAVR